jgi:hypothetical protein
MRKYIILVVGIWMMISIVYSQRIIISENFDDSTVSFSSIPANSWSKNNVYSISFSSFYWGKVPHAVGDSVILTTPIYNFTSYSYVLLRFKHICKISPQDKVSIEYRISGQTWKSLSASAYIGKTFNYSSTGFNAASYTKWMANDSTALPDQSWWEEESFDIGFEVGNENAVQFRFILKHGSVPATQVSYGWLLDDVEIIISVDEIKLPVVEFLSFVRDTVYTTGPFEINAKVKTTSTSRIETPWLKYRATYNGASVANDSILMTMVSGDSLWTAIIPQFVVGTEVFYSITGQDTLRNYTTIENSYVTKHPSSGFTGEVIIGTGTGTTNSSPIVLGSSYSFSRELYLGTEFTPNAQGGLITKLAWELTTATTLAATNQTCYFQAVNYAAITSYYIDPGTDGATLVWQGTLLANGAGWVEIILDKPFFLPPGKNLLIYWEHKGGLSTGSNPSWKYTTTSFMSTARGYSTTSFLAATTSALSVNNTRPNARFSIEGNTNSNSIALESIHFPASDTLLASIPAPVHICIRNKGIDTLMSCEINWTLNGNLQTPVSYTGNLPDDFTDTISLDSYFPSVNKWDTITVWVSMPNGVIDTITRDDTLTKLVYGRGDIAVIFIDSPLDTIYNTGPFDITAEIFSYSGAALGQPSLFVEYTFEGNTTYDTFPLFNTSGNLWKTNIPKKQTGNHVHYAIKLTDILGNHVETEENFYIKHFTGEFIGEIIIGTGTVSNAYTPMALLYEYGFSRQLYLGTEFSADATGGMITKLAWDYASTTPWTVPNQTCYFRAVDNTAITSGAYMNPVEDGAEPVWEGTLSASGAGWIEIILDKPFFLPPGKNLLIYWEQKSGIKQSSAVSWRHTSTSFNSTARGCADVSFLAATTSLLSFNVARANARFYVMGGSTDSNSVAITAINSPKKEELVNGIPVPIQISIQNKGFRNLDSCVVKWSLNEQVQPDSMIYRGALPDDFTDTITIGSYFPTAGKWDTIVVWTSMPNSAVDNVIYDDTLVKMVYGRSDIEMTFIDTPLDTVYNTGPFDITAEIISHSGVTAGQPSLFVEYTFEGNTTCDTLPLFNTSGNLWKTSIPQKAFGSQVHYAVKLMDILGNDIEIEDSYTIKHSLGFTGEIIIGTATTTNTHTPLNLFYEYSFSRQLYLGTEFSSNAQGVTITKLAWDYASATSWTFTNQTCYFQAVDDAIITNDAYIDPEANRAALVWQGNLSANVTGWIEITLNQPFFLPPGKNLLIYWEQKHGAYIFAVLNWRHTATSFNSTVYGFSTASFLDATISNLVLNNVRPNARFSLIEREPDSNSVSLESINSPLSDTLLAGVSVPVHITIRNRGTDNLTSCEINWTLNGKLQTPVSYTGNLPEDFTDTITVGYYTPVPGSADSIVVWLSMPNGVIDSLRYDDTSGVSTIACSPFGMRGDYVIGHSTSANAISIGLALSMIEKCGINGKVRFLLEKGVYTETVDFSSIADRMTAQDTLILTSLSGNNQDVVITSSWIGIILGNNRNIRIEAITVDVAATGTNAVQFTEACSNIVIRDCRLLANPNTKSITYNSVYKGSNTGVVDTILIIHNELDGGYYGFYFDGGIDNTAYGTNVVFDSNTVTNQYFYGIYTQYVDLISCSYNTILSLPENTHTSWYGLYMKYSNGAVIGNHIIQRSTAITSPYGIYVQYFNYENTSNKGLIANNEIILNTTGAYSGIYADYSKSEILHNSIYITGSGAARGIYIYERTTNNMAIKSNNIVLTSSSAYPIYFSATGYLYLYDIDYNNLYAPQYVGYYGGNITTMQAWQQTVSTDVHSVRILPEFIDSSVSLELAIYNNILLCPVAGILTDIKGFGRVTMTPMGAYMQSPFGQDLALLQISPWNREVINNQTVQVNVDLFNSGLVPVLGADFGWSLNGIEQQPSASWTATTPLNSLEQKNVTIGTFQVTGADTFNISVWIKTINGEQDTVNYNDTMQATTYVQPLVEFTSLLGDTIYTLYFNVDAKIHTITGAPVMPPVLYLETIVNGSTCLYDSILMIQKGDIWQANIPQQYYNSKVIYSLTVSDTVKNTFTVMDSVYIHLEFGKIDTVIIGASAVSSILNPISMASNYSWSRQIYLYREVCPDMSLAGTYITKMAWQSIAANSILTNQTCYMRAIDEDIEVAGYLDPLTSGLSPVWTGTLTVFPGWVEISLDTPFYLPVNKNLEIIWHHQHGSSAGSSSSWAHTSTAPDLSSIYAQGSVFPTTAGSLTNNRPNIKLTKKVPFSPYTGNNLRLLSFFSPVNDFEKLCATDYEPVRVIMGNLGENDYDFSVDSISIQVEIINPQQTKYTSHVSVHTGKLASGKADTIELMAALPVIYPGRYELKAWVESPIDDKPYDDTLIYSYISGRVALPVDEDFSGTFPQELAAQAVNTSAKWEIVSQGSGADTVVKPVFGSGMLAFSGSMGAMTYLSTRQLGLAGTTSPVLEFWYFHDTIPSQDYMDVRITTDGRKTYTLLKSLLKQDAAYGWQHYMADLTPYMNGQCVQLLFEAMRMSSGIGSQYIDRIIINSQPDLAISKIELPLESACDLSAAEMQVIISTLTNQTIDLSRFSTSLAVEISGYQSLPPVPLQKRLEGNSSDTISIIVPNLPSGRYTIKIYLTSPVDNLHGNDTAYYIVDIQPTLSVTVSPVTDVNNRLSIGAEVWQEAMIKNTGNVGISAIELLLRITGTEQYIIRETLPVNLAAGESYTHQFVNSYIVPTDERYQVSLIAYMACDSALVNAGNAIDEYVDMHNLFVIRIDNPPMGQPDTVGETVNITVSLANTDDLNSFKNVSILAAIENEEGQTLMNRLGIVEEILPLDTLQFTFRESYTIPEDSVYRIRVYLARVDNYPEDDTTEMIRGTVKRSDVAIKEINESNVFTLGQNIPNPANNYTHIDYSIPKAGEVVFHIHSVSGQLLYSKTIEAVSGKQSLELNTNTFAAGIYFYSIEYKGQRLIKRMMISGQVNE